MTFFLFAYDDYYPGGGMYDYVSSYASEKDAMQAFDGNADNAEIAVFINRSLSLVRRGWAEKGTYPRRIHWKNREKGSKGQ